ncbi:MAG: class I SAM-dependent methyltransferase [Deltaproteobacteria bacterium]|nr:class I SAM-dependent methyltransferase [Deltaproteobacteria bacterium]
MSTGGMYGDRAEYYDAIYHWKDYRTESERLCTLLRAEGVADGAEILEAACGTGSHLVHLRQHYAVTGFDISEPMIAIARSKLPGVPLYVADMTDTSAVRPASADALLCLFSAIGYVHPEERLQRAAQTFARALRPGGVLIVEPWLTERVYREGRVTLQTYEREDLKLARASVSHRAGELSVFDMHWLVAKQDAADVESFVEHHELWMCPTETMLSVFRAAGFEARFEADGLMKDRGLVIGRRTLRDPMRPPP